MKEKSKDKGEHRPLAICIAIPLLLMLAGTAAATGMPGVLWERTFDSGLNDFGNGLQETDDGGFVLAGKEQNCTTSDMLLLRTDRNGTVLWNRTYDYGIYDTANAVRVTPDGGYILAGYGQMDVDGEKTDGMMMVRTNSAGTPLWTGPTGNISPTWEEATDIRVCDDGGFVLTGRDNPESGPGAAYLVRTDENGEVEWSTRFLRMYDDAGYSVLQTEDGGYLVAGTSADPVNGTVDAFLRKTNETGALLWERYYAARDLQWPSQGEEGDFQALKVLQTADGGYALAGKTVFERPETAGAALIKTDADGEAVWSRFYNTTCTQAFWAEDFVETSDRGFVLACHFDPVANPQNVIYLLRTNETGEITWQDFYSLGLLENDPHAIVLTADGGYAIGGESGICKGPTIFTGCSLDAFILKLGKEPPGPPPSQPFYADFAAFPRSGTAPLTVQFIDRSAGEPTTWSWNFGDGAKSNERYPVHTYTKAGTYTVSLTVTDGSRSDTETKRGYITVAEERLQANISFVPENATFPAGENRTFDVVMDRADKGVAFYSLAIDLTDRRIGEIVKVEMPEWLGTRFMVSPVPADSVVVSGIRGSTDSGTENVILCRVTVRGDTGGQSDLVLGGAQVIGPGLEDYVLDTGKARLTVTATPTPPAPLGANFTAEPLNGTAPLEVNFTDTSTGTPISWAWAFGDGNTSTERDPTHAYENPGLYTVNLTVSDGKTFSSRERTDYINVSAPLRANFTAEPLNGTAPLEVNFTDTSTGTPISWAWVFGDGNVSTDPDPTHVYENPGLYTVNLTVSDIDEMDNETKVDFINVTAP
jgi:PKD repeat protein